MRYLFTECQATLSGGRQAQVEQQLVVAGKITILPQLKKKSRYKPV
jgi:hypothetical protein